MYEGLFHSSLNQFMWQKIIGLNITLIIINNDNDDYDDDDYYDDGCNHGTNININTNTKFNTLKQKNILQALWQIQLLTHPNNNDENNYNNNND